MTKHIFIIDTSALLSGKPLNVGDAQMMTTPLVEQELQPGGRDYRLFQFLKEKGLIIQSPSPNALTTVCTVATKSGDRSRLSSADTELLALAVDIQSQRGTTPVIITDDYSIQNVAQLLHITYQPYAQKGILQTYKWQRQCPGCKKICSDSTLICTICGTETKLRKSKKK